MQVCKLSCCTDELNDKAWAQMVRELMHRECKRNQKQFVMKYSLLGCTCVHDNKKSFEPDLTLTCTPSISWKHHKSFLIPTGYFKSFKLHFYLYWFIVYSFSFSIGTTFLLYATGPREAPLQNQARLWYTAHGRAFQALYLPDPVRYNADWDPWWSSIVPWFGLRYTGL